jgi:hypothetical protein
MNLFLATIENMTEVQRIESAHRFKTLPMTAKATACFCKCEVDFPGPRVESFRLREASHDVSVRMFAAPTALETSAV